MTRSVTALLSALFGTMAFFGCGKGGTLTAGEVVKNAEKYNGQKVKVTGIYAQSFSKGGRPTDPWALVIRDAPSDKFGLYCIIPAKVDIKGNYPKMTAEGTVQVETSGPKGVNLLNCTYKIEN
jgi:hypothetical protein